MTTHVSQARVAWWRVLLVLVVLGGVLWVAAPSRADSDGFAVAWGPGQMGQLGDGNAWQTVPVAVDTSGVLAGKTVTAVSTGAVHSCAVADGKAYCWGSGEYGQLGNGTTSNSSVPVAVDTSGVLAGKTVTAVSAGGSHSCAVADGSAYCWGSGEFGQLGNDTTNSSSVPVAVDTSGVLAGKTVTAVSAGGAVHSCAVADGKAYCWGSGYKGVLGNNATDDSSVPVAVHTSGELAGKTVTAVSAGGSHSCAVADGSAYCWGSGSQGQLGNGATGNARVPVRAPTGGTVTAVSAGDSHSCAVADGKAYCWGSGFKGVLGNNATNDSTVPVAVDTSGVLAGKTVTAVSAGASLSCAVADGKAYCWGSGEFGQLGNDTTSNSSVPVAVDTSGVLAGKTVTAALARTFHSCAVADGKAYCWGWGESDSGLLGNNTSSESRVPVAVDTSGVLAGKTVTAVSAGGSHSCAVADGKAYCWGAGESGQLGNDMSSKSRVPVAVDTSGVLAGKTVTAVSAGGSLSCAVADGKAYCWGAGSEGQLGNNTWGNSSLPVAVDTSGVLAGRTVTAVSAGGIHTCAVADGGAYCWGSGSRLGDNANNNTSVPVAVDTYGVLAGKTVTAVSAGGSHSCAVADGKAYCWGSGMLGNNTWGNSRVPVAVDTSGVLAGKTVTAVSAGTSHTCAVADGKAYCWGSGFSGVLGNNGTDDARVPVAVDTSGVLADRTVTAVSAGANGLGHVLAVARLQPAVPAFAAAPDRFLFGDQLVDSTSLGSMITVTNTGTADLEIGSITLRGDDPGQFSVTEQTCASRSIPPNGTCTVTVRFTPTSAGAKTAWVDLSSNAADSPHLVAVTGTGRVAAPPPSGPQPPPSQRPSPDATPPPPGTGPPLANQPPSPAITPTSGRPQKIAAVAHKMKPKKKVNLPTRTQQGAPLTWVTSSKRVCKVKDGKVVALRKGTCTLTFKAPAVNGFKPHSGRTKIRIK